MAVVKGYPDARVERDRHPRGGPDMDQRVKATANVLRAPRAAAFAGILFSLMLGVALILIRATIPEDPSDSGAWMTDDRKELVKFALGLIPFAGIAFLWFIGVVRDRIGALEDRLFATVFLGSGLLFVALLFVAASVAAGVLFAPALEDDEAAWSFGRYVSFTLLSIYAMRMGALFVLSTTTIAVRTGIAPRWLGILGYVVTVALLVGVGINGWVSLLMPAWVLLLSIQILLSNRAGGGDEGPERAAGPAP
jgi:hypothetical protein